MIIVKSEKGEFKYKNWGWNLAWFLVWLFGFLTGIIFLGFIQKF
jgi:hypothetical protein